MFALTPNYVHRLQVLYDDKCKINAIWLSHFFAQASSYVHSKLDVVMINWY